MSRIWFLRAAMALGTTLGLAAPALALNPADLQTSVSTTVTTAAASANVTYTVTVTNLATYGTVCAFDPAIRRRVCERDVNSADAGPVTVLVSLAPGMSFPSNASPAGDSGFICTKTSLTQASCFNGFIQAEGSARITVLAKMPNAAGTVQVSATASLVGAAERTTSNNTAAASVSVQAPPNPNLPDLFATVSPLRATSVGTAPVDYEIRIYNHGPVDAPNVSLEYRTYYPTVYGTPSFVPQQNTNCPFLVAGADGFPQGVRCTGIYVPAFNSVLMKVRVIPRSPWSFQVPAGTPYPIAGFLDPDYAIQELNERNNQFNGGVLLSPGP